MKIPVKDAVEASDQAPEPAELVVEKEEADMAEEPAEMTEEEMVEAAIRAGEEAADNDFKLKYEKVEAELARAPRASLPLPRIPRRQPRPRPPTP